MALAMNLDALILYPDAHLPSWRIWRKMGIPVLLGRKKGIEWIAEQAFELALDHQEEAAQILFAHSSESAPGSI
jgi:hypothetical protein